MLLLCPEFIRGIVKQGSSVISHLSSSGSTFAAHARHSRKVTTNTCDICGQIFTWSGDAKRRGIEVVMVEGGSWRRDLLID